MRQSVNSKIAKFTNNDILSSSAWSSVIHQPSQDSEPEDLPSTVDINAIKEFTTPVNASAQTPSHGDCNLSAFSDDQNAGESGTDSDSESDSGNSENEVENHGSGADSVSCSDSDSVSSRRSSGSSSRSKLSSPQSSRSNSPAFNGDNCRKPFSLPRNCNLSEDSNDGTESPSILGTGVKRSADAAAKKSGLSCNAENLQVLNEADLASVFLDAKSTMRITSEATDSIASKRSSKPVVETKKMAAAAFSDSSSDSEMLPKQVVRDAINSIHVEPRSPTDFTDREEQIPSVPFQSHKTLTKDTKDASKMFSYLTASVNDRVSADANSCASFDMFHGQEKRGPGRPRKTKPDPKMKAAREQGNSKRNSISAPVPYPMSAKVSSVAVPALPTHSDYPRKHKKRKKKDTKEKLSNPELVKEIDELNEFFSKKCVIEDRRLSCSDTSSSRHLTITRSKVNQRNNKEKNKKRKLSDRESEPEVTCAVPHDVKTKRRYKKSTTETPKVHRTNFDQRLPLKKRHYHVSAPSAGQNASHLTQSSSKVRVERQVAESSSEESHRGKLPEFCNLPPTLSSMKKEKPRKRTKNVDSDTPPVLDEYSRQPENTSSSKSVSSLLGARVPPSKMPELITPLPREPSSGAASPSLKPPAGVFEPTRKLSPGASLLKQKRTPIDDIMSKLKENLEGLEPSSGAGDASTEKTADSVCGNENGPPFKRVLRPKKMHLEKEDEKEKEKENPSKKSKVLKGVTIRLLKLPIGDSSDPNVRGDMKPKPKIVKRRKTRNRTGFPILKKKKKKLQRVVAISPSPLSVETESAELENSSKMNEEVEEEGEGEGRTKKVVLSKQRKQKVDETEKSAVAEDNMQTARKIQLKKKGGIERKEGILPVGTGTSARSLRKREPPPGGKRVRQAAEPKKFKHESKQKPSNSKKDETAECSVSISRLLRKREPLMTSAKKPVAVVGEKMKDREKMGSSAVERGQEDTTKEGKTKKEVRVKEDTRKDESSDDSKKDGVPKKKRKYVPAGLFSDYFKEDRCTSVDIKNRHIAYKSEDHPHSLLPPPPYFEDFVRRRRVEFKLPYDLWWLHTYDKLPGRDIVESWKYKRLKMNVYYDVKPPHGYEAQACNCKMPEEKDKLGCGDDCINRVVYAECSPDLCPLKERCSNQRIQKHNVESIKLSKFMTKDKGIGVKTQKFIKAGEYIVEYVGEVVTDKEFKNRMTSLYKNDIHHYCLNLEGGLLIDGHRMGSDARFVNHSCEPNCEIQKWSVNGRFRMGLFAQRDIEQGEELTYDYNFSLFNPEEGQPCRCGSKECRGVIGGKSQRVSFAANASANSSDASCSTLHAPHQAVSNSQTSKTLGPRPRKQTRKNSNVHVNMKNIGRRDSDSSGRVLPRRSALDSIPMEPLTSGEKEIVRAHRILMTRNLAKVERVRERMKRRRSTDDKGNANGKKQNGGGRNDKPKQPIEFMRQLNALTQQRFIKTRGLAQVEDDPEMNKTLQLANLFRTIYTCVISAKDENSGEAFSSFFVSLPSKQKLPMYYQRIEEPIDLSMVEKNIVTGVYKDVESFDKDMNKLIANNVKYYGRTSEHGIAAIRLRKAYNIAKLDHIKQVEEITGQTVPTSFRPVQENPGDEEEDVIRCICGLHNDEGMMIQCERCLVWQHIGCVKANTDVEHYYCERCSSREVDYEVPLDVPPPDYPEPNEKHFLTLMREDLQIRQGDTVYVLRDLRDPATNARHTYRTIGTFKYEDCDILRVEQLWKTQNGDKFAFGHHYLRPCETFHEPTRKFFPNELLKRSVYETVPLDLIMGRCYVLDLRTYCRGRPIDADPEHIYICEYSVNKDMNTFHKMKSKQPCPVSMKSYAFEMYDTRLRPIRTYTPHLVPLTSNRANLVAEPPKSTLVSNQSRGRASKPKEVESQQQRVAEPVFDNSIDEDDLPLARMRDSKTADKRKQRLNSILLKLLAKKTCKSPLDVSYLLEMGRRNRTIKKPIQQTTINT